ncbi:MAG TPA: hypothetical protein VJT84_14085 [Gaiellaceae bacterium]|nr:hypothetical protein [Gaiellaceae bacterium]
MRSGARTTACHRLRGAERPGISCPEQELGRALLRAPLAQDDRVSGAGCGSGDDGVGRG